MCIHLPGAIRNSRTKDLQETRNGSDGDNGPSFAFSHMRSDSPAQSQNSKRMNLEPFFSVVHG